jgi:hypothetical protein
MSCHSSRRPFSSIAFLEPNDKRQRPRCYAACGSIAAGLITYRRSRKERLAPNTRIRMVLMESVLNLGRRNRLVRCGTLEPSGLSVIEANKTPRTRGGRLGPVRPLSLKPSQRSSGRPLQIASGPFFSPQNRPRTCNSCRSDIQSIF